VKESLGRQTLPPQWHQTLEATLLDVATESGAFMFRQRPRYTTASPNNLLNTEELQMRTYVYDLVLVAVLGGAVAFAQNSPRQQQSPTAMPEIQQQPTSQQGKAPADVQNEIQSALQKDKRLADASINVQVTEQSVELSGTVPTKDAKDAAEQIARAHSGGLEVKNLIKVGG
jgi:osmotically-inducible protein OsmY